MKLLATSEDGSLSEEIVLDFDSSEIELLARYLANCDRLMKAKIFVAGFPSIKNISWKAGEGITFEISEFDYGHVCELLHLARPIFLSQEPGSLEKTLAVFGKKVQGTALAKHLKFIRGVYERGDYQPYFQISVNDTPLFHDETLKAWLNGVEYHQDAEKATLVASLQEALGETIARGIFISQLSGRIRGAQMVAHLCELVVKGGAGDG